MYAQVENVPVGLRPDNSGVIFEKLTDKLVFGTVVTSMEISPLGYRQAEGFREQGFSVVLAASSWLKPKVLLADGHKLKHVERKFSKIVSSRL